jgi:hypothetical protein
MWFCFTQTGGSAACSGEAMDFTWWRMTAQEIDRDGSMLTVFELMMPDGKAPGEIAAFYVTYPQIGKRSMRRYGPPEAYRKVVGIPANGEKPVITIRSGRSERVELFSRIRSGDDLYYAQTMFTGNGGFEARDMDIERIDRIPDWPAFRFADLDFIRARTETPVLIDCDAASETVRVFEDRNLTASVRRGELGLYSYTPPHDEALSQASYTTYKDLVMEAKISDGTGTISLYLPLYRVYYGKISLRHGLVSVCIGTCVGLLFLTRQNRRCRIR